MEIEINTEMIWGLCEVLKKFFIFSLLWSVLCVGVRWECVLIIIHNMREYHSTVRSEEGERIFQTKYDKLIDLIMS